MFKNRFYSDFKREKTQDLNIKYHQILDDMAVGWRSMYVYGLQTEGPRPMFASYKKTDKPRRQNFHQFHMPEIKLVSSSILNVYEDFADHNTGNFKMFQGINE